jgi:formate/nitrite transporter FocA (FNT family)
MTLLTLGNLLASAEAVTWSGMTYNLIPVTIGNFVSGFLFMGAAYWYVEAAPSQEESDSVAAPTSADD